MWGTEGKISSAPAPSQAGPAVRAIAAPAGRLDQNIQEVLEIPPSIAE